MALDPSIPLQVRPVNIDMAQLSPMNTMLGAFKLRQLEQEGEINAMGLAERRGVAKILSDPANKLTDPIVQNALAGLGEYGRKTAETGARITTAATGEETRRQDLANKTLLGYKEIMPAEEQGVPALLSWYDKQLKDPRLAGTPLAGKSLQDIADSIPSDPEALRQFYQRTALGMSKYVEQNKPSTYQVNRFGQTDVMSRPGLGGAPTTLGTYSDVPLPAGVETQKVRIAQASRPITNVNLPPQEKAEQGERGKMLVSEYSDISKAAKLATKILPSIDANLSILDKGFSTGFGTETVAAGAKVLSALGVANADKFATDAQVFQAKATEAVLNKQLEQKGPQTESDAQRIDQIGAQLGKTTAGNKFVLTTAKEQLKRDMEQRNFYDNWWKQNKTYDGAEDAWYSGEGGKSLFDRPALKTYVKSAETPAAAAANKPSLDSIFKAKRP